MSYAAGGMENPCLTFVTPTLIAGDRSQANVVAHEIAHSWCGNLVTNRTWEHFWMNEGFTVFLERCAPGALSSRERPSPVQSRVLPLLLSISRISQPQVLLG
jgi:leukotriene-A4 hydrolase